MACFTLSPALKCVVSTIRDTKSNIHENNTNPLTTTYNINIFVSKLCYECLQITPIASSFFRGEPKGILCSYVEQSETVYF